MLTEGHFQEFSSEAVTWRQLSHPNVLPFYGVFKLERNPPRVCLACPWMENGNLERFLADRAPNTDCVPLVCNKLKVRHGIHYEWFAQSLDVALGLEYLHGEGIIHGDLKAVRPRLSLAP
jgi:serine/threonine protein kinase